MVVHAVISFVVNLVSYVAGIVIGVLFNLLISIAPVPMYVAGAVFSLLCTVLLEGATLQRQFHIVAHRVWRKVFAFNVPTWIAGLAIICVPYLLHEGLPIQKISPVKTDMLSIAHSLESYRSEHGLLQIGEGDFRWKPGEFRTLNRS